MDRLLTIMRAALADARKRGAMDEYAIVLRGLTELQWMAGLATMPTAKLPVAQRKDVAA